MGPRTLPHKADGDWQSLRASAVSANQVATPLHALSAVPRKQPRLTSLGLKFVMVWKRPRWAKTDPSQTRTISSSVLFELSDQARAIHNLRQRSGNEMPRAIYYLLPLIKPGWQSIAGSHTAASNVA